MNYDVEKIYNKYPYLRKANRKGVQDLYKKALMRNEWHLSSELGVVLEHLKRERKHE